MLSGIAYLTERVRIILTALINQNMNGVLLTDVISPTEAAQMTAVVFKQTAWTDPSVIQIVRNKHTLCTFVYVHVFLCVIFVSRCQ